MYLSVTSDLRFPQNCRPKSEILRPMDESIESPRVCLDCMLRSLTTSFGNRVRTPNPVCKEILSENGALNLKILPIHSIFQCSCTWAYRSFPLLGLYLGFRLAIRSLKTVSTNYEISRPFILFVCLMVWWIFHL